MMNIHKQLSQWSCRENIHLNYAIHWGGTNNIDHCLIKTNNYHNELLRKYTSKLCNSLKVKIIIRSLIIFYEIEISYNIVLTLM